MSTGNPPVIDKAHDAAAILAVNHSAMAAVPAKASVDGDADAPITDEISPLLDLHTDPISTVAGAPPPSSAVNSLESGNNVV